jgi:protein tyrosine phosphatase
MNTSRATRTMPATSNSPSPPYQLLNDDDCCYRLRTLRITTEDRKTWEIYHWQYLAWGDHGQMNNIVFFLKYIHFLLYRFSIYSKST